ncbi:MAG TPA: DUF4278 domain-containing protein [Candidatus Obscuribacterales bacterium]
MKYAYRGIEYTPKSSKQLGIQTSLKGTYRGAALSFDGAIVHVPDSVQVLTYRGINYLGHR